MSEPAPILVVTFCRYEHFKQVVESLSKNHMSKDTPLYVAIDYPSKDSHREGHAKIIKYLESVNGFKSLTIIKRHSNYGAVRNLKEAVNEVLGLYDRIIVTEDDNVFSTNFLDYMNSGLEKYQGHPDIYAVCGYLYLTAFPKSYRYNHFYAHAFSALGYGIWKDRHEQLMKIADIDYAKSVIGNLRKLLAIYLERPRSIISLAWVLETKYVAWDMLFTIFMITEKKYCVFPAVSKLRNIGNDGSGLHSVYIEDDPFSTQTIDDAKHFVYDDIPQIMQTKVIKKMIRTYFHISLKGQLYSLFRFIYCWFTRKFK